MAGHKRGREDGAGGGRAHAGERHSFSRVDADTATYFREIDGTLKTLDDDSEKRLLADNVLEEAAGQEVEIATDAACSRVVEALIAHASLERQAAFLSKCVEGENLGGICTRWAPQPRSKRAFRPPL
jgi:hypothetical protein